MADAVRQGREAFARRAWAEAHAHLESAGSLEPDDLERLAVAAYLTGHDEDGVRAWEEAHREHLARGAPGRAAHCAAWLGISLLLRGETARASGWLARGEREVEEAGPGCAARGLVLVAVFLDVLRSGDARRAATLADEIVEIGRTCDDPDVAALGALCRGEALVALGDQPLGMKAFDEVMLSVTSDEVSPIPAGIVYCGVIEACMDLGDFPRAAEWTEALHRWSSAMPDLVPYRGQCLVHRSQVLQARGAWGDAIAEAERARDRLSEPLHPALGRALYQQGELLRLLGEFDDAERAYRAASERGHDPYPGLALLRLAQGDVTAALGAVPRLVEESVGRLDRPVMLAAAVEILLAAGDREAARRAGDATLDAVRERPTPTFEALADHAHGAVLLAGGDAAAAIAPLRSAAARWRELAMPYEVARTRALIARACDVLGDHDGARLERDAARATFEQLGALPDVAGLPDVDVAAARAPSTPLTERECEVLRLVAAGKSNREVATELVISEHTVARHLQNIFMKLDLSSRAAATAYAYEHGIV